MKTSLPNLSLDDIESLFTEKRAFEQYEEIFAEGDTGDGAYFILDGSVSVIAFTSDFKEIVLGELGAGQIFGEMALIDDKPRLAMLFLSEHAR